MRILVKHIGSRRRTRWDEEVVAEIKRRMDSQVKPGLIKLFEEVVSDWDTHIKFRARKTERGGDIIVYVFPVGSKKAKKIWNYVSRGTGLHGPKRKKYRIPKEGKKLLAFPMSYAPHTKVGGGRKAPGYGGPGTYSGKTVFAMHVWNPGIEGRHFEEAIARRYRPKFDRIMAKAIVVGISNARRKAKR